MRDQVKRKVEQHNLQKVEKQRQEQLLQQQEQLLQQQARDHEREAAMQAAADGTGMVVPAFGTGAPSPAPAAAPTFGGSTSASPPAPVPAPAASGGMSARTMVEQLLQDPSLSQQQKKTLTDICQAYMLKTVDKTEFYQRLCQLIGKPKVKETMQRLKQQAEGPRAREYTE